MAVVTQQSEQREEEAQQRRVEAVSGEEAAERLSESAAARARSAARVCQKYARSTCSSDAAAAMPPPAQQIRPPHPWQVRSAPRRSKQEDDAYHSPTPSPAHRRDSRAVRGLCCARRAARMRAAGAMPAFLLTPYRASAAHFSLHFLFRYFLTSFHFQPLSSFSSFPLLCHILPFSFV